MSRTLVELLHAWPRMLTLSEAAKYCGLSTTKFQAICPVPSTQFTNADRRWDKHLLDAWLDGLQVPHNLSSQDILARL
jgi:hypothetical protein